MLMTQQHVDVQEDLVGKMKRSH